MNRLIVECYCANFENYDLFEAILRPLRAQGIGIELSIFDDSAYNARLIAQRRRFSGDYTTFHGPHVGVEAASPADSPAQKRIIAAYAEALKIYAQFHAHSMVMHTNQRAFRPEEKARLQAQSVLTINAILDMARAAGADLLVENVGWANAGSMLFDQDEFIALFSRLRPWAHCLLDTGHAMINGWDFERVIAALAPKIKAYHLHNNDGKRDIHRPMFDKGLLYGEADVRRLMGLIEKYTPNADWILEYAPGSHITPALIAEECQKMLALRDHPAATPAPAG